MTRTRLHEKYLTHLIGDEWVTDLVYRLFFKTFPFPRSQSGKSVCCMSLHTTTGKEPEAKVLRIHENVYALKHSDVGDGLGSKRSKVKVEELESGWAWVFTLLIACL